MKKIHWYDYITINIYWLGLNMLTQTMTPLVVPLLIQQFVGESFKGTFYGNLRLWTLMMALLVQALMGMLSDHSTSRFGRRRPFIVAGTLVDLIIIAAIGFSASLQGMTGYWVLFFLIVLLMISANTSHGALQGLIPDVVPLQKRGMFSAIKAMLEVPLPLILVSFTVGRVIGKGNLWGGLLITSGFLVASMLLTLLVREEPQRRTDAGLDWKPFIRLLGMTTIFTLIILSVGWVTRLIQQILVDNHNPLALSIIMVFVGVVGMSIAVGIGVLLSVYVSVGSEIKKVPSFPWWVVNRLTFLVGATNLAGFIVYFLQARLGLVREAAASPAAFLLMFVGVFILVSTLPAGYLADKFGKKKLVLISGITASFGTAVALLLPNLTIIYIGGCFIGAASGLFYTANWALGTEIVPPEQAGRFLGISNLAGAGAGAIGAYIGGPIADFLGRQLPQTPELGYVILFAIYGIMFLLSILALPRIKEPDRQTTEI